MASHSDVDEDELLQIALQEQAARDLSHQRPPAANKPVVNLVRPPAPNARGSNARAGSAAAKARQPSRGGDEDDDSEVELLSISSGDEDDDSEAALRRWPRPSTTTSARPDQALVATLGSSPSDLHASGARRLDSISAAAADAAFSKAPAATPSPSSGAPSSLLAAYARLGCSGTARGST